MGVFQINKEFQKEIKIGTCGWGGKKSKYYETFSCIELQETFYKLPKIETLEKYRLESPKNFEFIIKAWQVITHPYNSPTWKKSTPPKWGKIENFGYLKPTEENFKAWEEIIKICKILKSKIIIIQTPPSFNPSKDNIENMKKFLSSINREDLILGWEPRGDWNSDIIANICKELNLIHVVDPFRRLPSIESNIIYFRLHGIGGKETNYRYVYTNEDLNKLYNIIMKINAEIFYVMFNNIKMIEDAIKFMKIINLKLQ
ncbi:MAG: DUF72 domain-containing protein [Candidatus Verstraetearchaeota archaeon]|nr:DUF72 domain-containing protein [Candidatus Verstraetearchaeota archaeon]